MALLRHMTAVVSILTAVAFVLATGCAQPQIDRAPVRAAKENLPEKESRKDKPSKDRESADAEEDQEGDGDGSDEGSGDSQLDDGDGISSLNNGDDEVTDDPTIIVYPTLTFNATGYTTYKNDDRLQMTSTIVTNLNGSELSVNMTQARVLCGDLDGCKQDEVDESVQKNTIGANRYAKVDKSALRTLESSGLKVSPFTIYANALHAKNGFSYTLDKPLPVYPWPAAMSRFSDLDNGPVTWTATATANQYVPNRSHVTVDSAQRIGSALEASGQVRRTISVTVTVSKEVVSDRLLKVTYETTLAEDNDHMLYKYFALPRKCVYLIDTKARNILGADMLGWSNGDRSKQAETTEQAYKLCSKEQNGKTESFTCN